MNVSFKTPTCKITTGNNSKNAKAMVMILCTEFLLMYYFSIQFTRIFSFKSLSFNLWKTEYGQKTPTDNNFRNNENRVIDLVHCNCFQCELSVFEVQTK